MTFAWPYKCGAREIGSARLRSFVGCRRRTGATGYVLSLPTRTRNVTLHVLGFRFLSLVIVLITKLPLPCKSTDCLLSLLSYSVLWLSLIGVNSRVNRTRLRDFIRLLLGHCLSPPFASFNKRERWARKAEKKKERNRER